METKNCTSKNCKEINPQPLSSFHKDKSTKDGLRYICKSCSVIKARESALRNKEKVAARHRNYQQEHREELAEYMAVYGPAYYLKNKEEIDAYQLTYRTENRELCNARIAAWTKANPGKRNAITIKYRASKLQRTLPWLTDVHYQEIQKFYIEAAMLTEETGILHTVDHIVPLQGENVSGLHVPWNLQVLVGPGPNGNFAKGNKF